MSEITFSAPLTQIANMTIVRLPAKASASLPSRGLNIATAICNGHTFTAILEPDGRKGHWFELPKELHSLTNKHAVQPPAWSLTLLKQWPEPKLPTDFLTALKTDTAASAVWDTLTPAAHWDWLRWIRAPKQASTHQRRIEVACSKLRSGMRRPCCFNRNECTVPQIATSGVLTIERSNV